MELRCLACGSNRVVEGRLGWADEPFVFRLPPQEKSSWRTLGPAVDVERYGYLCVDCGTVWTRADKREVEKELARSGSDELLGRLRIPARPKRKWFWLLFGER